MALVNIGEDNRSDTFYRYKMPKLVTKIEGRGNGIKTNLVNMVDVAKALDRPPAYTTKFFGCVLGAQSKFEEKTGTSTVNGSHDTSKLVQLLETFIKKYVQCYACGNPETQVLVTKDQRIQLKCAACGHMSDVDMRDKLTTYILKNPPEQKKGKSSSAMRRAEKERLKAGEALDEENKKSKLSGKKESAKRATPKKKEEEKDSSPDASNKDEGEEADEDDDDDVEWLTDASAAAAAERIKEQLSAATSEMVLIENDSLPTPPGKDSSDSGTKGKPTRSSSNGKASTPVHSSVADSPTPAPTPAGEGAKDGPEKDEAAEADEDEAEVEVPQLAELSLHDKLVKELKDFVVTHTLSETANYVNSRGDLSQVFMNALIEALFGGIGKGLAKEVDKKASLLSKVLPDGAAQQKLLVAIEVFCTSAGGPILKEVPLVLKALYDKDVVDEEQIFEWFDSQGSDKSSPLDAKACATVRKQAAPFVVWLREAESESDEE